MLLAWRVPVLSVASASPGPQPQASVVGAHGVTVLALVAIPLLATVAVAALLALASRPARLTAVAVAGAVVLASAVASAWLRSPLPLWAAPTGLLLLAACEASRRVSG
ncbi:MAG: hypothetical protein JWM85_948 [Acidimicrobiaceae bacterium]|nr:hypothetical protein [Acidimicrobiaceae bacterium]